MRTRPLISLAVVPLVLLAGIGVAAALWTETLTIDGEVATAEFDAGWTFARCWETDPLDMADVQIVEADALGDIGELHNITFDVGGAYPTYTAGCAVEYNYTGSIPARVENIEFDPGNLTGCTVTTYATGKVVAECDQMMVSWVDGLCTELVHDDEVVGDLKIWVHDGVPPDTEFNFMLGVEIKQLTNTVCPS